MKEAIYLIQVPILLIGIIAGTIWFGVKNRFKAAMEYWEDYS